MIDYHRLSPKRGMLVLDWWRNLIRWAQTLPVIAGPGVFLTATPLGMKVRVRTGSPVYTPFQVFVTGREARILSGTVDGEVPWIVDVPRGQDPVRLDGRNEAGIYLGASGVRLPITDSAIDGRSYLVIEIRHRTLAETRAGLDPENLTIRHRLSLTPADRAAGVEAGIHYQPLAVLYWSPDNRTIDRVGQVAHHDFQLFVDGDGIAYCAAT
jgi:hypothetical protein